MFSNYGRKDADVNSIIELLGRLNSHKYHENTRREKAQVILKWVESGYQIIRRDNVDDICFVALHVKSGLFARRKLSIQQSMSCGFDVIHQMVLDLLREVQKAVNEQLQTEVEGGV